MIEIDLRKFDRGTHEGTVTVHRGGKTFQRKQKLGTKDKVGDEKPKGTEPKAKETKDTKPKDTKPKDIKPFKDWKAGMPHPAGFKDGAIVDMGDGVKRTIEADSIVVPYFKCGDGIYTIQDISKIYGDDATNAMPDLTEYEGKKTKEKEEKTAQVKRMQAEETDASKEKFENDANKFFKECRGNEKDANNLSSLKEYSGKNYSEVNKYLITGTTTEDKDEMDLQIRNISAILSKAPKYEGTVYRGMRFDNFDEFADFISQCGEGEQISMSNFASTSLNKGVASKFATGFDYSVSCTIKSKNGVFLGDVSQNVDEKEVLFNHESEFNISDVKKITDNKFEIIMEEI